MALIITLSTESVKFRVSGSATELMQIICTRGKQRLHDHTRYDGLWHSWLGIDVSLRHLELVSIDREAGIDERNEGRHDVANMYGLVVVALGDSEGWCWDNLLPTQAHMGGEDDDSHEVEEDPTKRLKYLKLHAVDVPHRDAFSTSIHPKEIEPQAEQCSKIHQVWRRAQLKLVCLAEAELEEVYGHESQKCNARNGQVQLARCDCVVDGDVPSSFQRHDYVEQSCEQYILLDDVCRETKAGPIQADVEVAVAVEVVRTEEHMKIAYSVDDDKHKQEHRRACKTNAVICEHKVFLWDDCEDDLLHEAQHHVD